MQGAQIRRNEAYLPVRRNDCGCSATQQMDFLLSRQLLIIIHQQGLPGLDLLQSLELDNFLQSFPLPLLMVSLEIAYNWIH